MATDFPDCVIASSGRYRDIWPYSCHVFHEEPKKWGAIFPWDFPQDADRATEERFLREHFSEREIHMQGGAQGEGLGFRFLKQVWNTIALFNYEHRVPAMANWWWEQPGSKALLDDAKMVDYMLSPEACLGTFGLAAPEIETYGERFLGIVMMSLQRTALAHKENKEYAKQRAKEDNEPKTGSIEIVAIPEEAQQTPQSASETETKKVVGGTGAEEATATETVSSSLSVPLLASAESQRVMTTESSPPLIAQVNPQKQASSRGRAYRNNRSGSFRGRQSYSHPDWSGQSFPIGPIYATEPPAQMVPLATAPFAHSFPPPHFNPGGNAIPYMHQGLNVPPMSANNHSMIVPPYFNAQQHVGYSSMPPFTDRTNEQQSQRLVSNSSSNNGFEDSNNTHSGHRYYSQAPRGGKHASYNTVRGKGSRSQNSFGNNAPLHVASEDVSFGRKFSNDYEASAVLHNVRNGSIPAEEIWRSSNEYSQTRHDSRAKEKENMISNSDYSNAGSRQPTEHGAGQSAYTGQLNQWTDITHHVRPPAPQPGSHAGFQRQPNFSQRKGTDLDYTCDRDRIGGECLKAVKLLTFDVPECIDEAELGESFKNRVPGLLLINRAKFHKKFHNDARVSSGYNPGVWFIFSSHIEARRFLEDKQSHWIRDITLRIEVAKEFWDRKHPKYEPPYPGHRQHSMSQVPNSGNDGFVAQASAQDTRVKNSTRVKTTETPDKGQKPSQQAAGTQLRTESPKKTGKKPGKKNTINKTKLKQNQHPPLETALQQNGQTKRTEDNEAASTSTVVDVTQHGSENQAKAAICVDKVEAKDVDSKNDAPPKVESHPSPSSPEEKRSAAPTGESKFPITPTHTSEIGNAQDEQAETPSAKESTRVRHEKKDSEEPAAVTIGTPSKSDEDQVDDSFHTASGTPDTQKNGERAGGTNSAIISEGHGCADSTESGSKSDVTTTVASHETKRDSVKSIKRAPVPQITLKKNETSRTPSEAKLVSLQPTQCSTSVGSHVPPTPAFETAPCTPADLCEQEKTDHINPEKPGTDDHIVLAPPQSANERVKTDAPEAELPDVTSTEPSPPIKKVERPKGPAQTESLNPFGKKQQKKPKEKKGKATLKGKPKMDETMMDEMKPASAESANTSRAVSQVHAPEESNAEVNLCTNTTANDKDKKGDGEIASETTQPVNPAPQTGPHSIDSQAPQLPETSNKLAPRLLGLIFGSGQQHVQKDIGAGGAALTSSIMPNESPDQVSAVETQTLERVDLLGEEPVSADICSDSAGPTSDKNLGANEGQEKLARRSASDSEDNCSQPNDEGEGNIGLGISADTMNASVDGESKTKRKNKKKNKSKKKKDPQNATTDPSPNTLAIGKQVEPSATSNIPNASRSKVTAVVIHSSNRKSGGSSEVASNCSSRTLERTPSPEPGSSMGSTPRRRLPQKSHGAGHLIEGKQPQWKRGKRLTPGRTQEIEAVEVIEQGEETVWIVNPEEEHNAAFSKYIRSPETDRKVPNTICIIFNRNDAADGEVAQNKTNLEQLAIEDSDETMPAAQEEQKEHSRD